MKVKELKEHLDKFEDDLDVYVFENEDYIAKSDGKGGMINQWFSTALPLGIVARKRILNGEIVARPCKETKGAKKCVVLFSQSS